MVLMINQEKPYNRKFRTTIIIGFGGLLIFWIVFGSQNARKLNSDSLVSIGIITDTSSSYIKYEYSDGKIIYKGQYKQSKIQRKLDDKILIRFHPPEPTIHMVIPGIYPSEINRGIGDVIDSLNTSKLYWWDID